MPLSLYNTLTKRHEPFIPIDPSHVTFYSCGPTVYDDAHIGNFRSFLAADILRRFVESPLCELSDGKGGVHKGPRRVTHVMNITDVGHMTDDAEGGEHGEDRMSIAGKRLEEAKKSGKLPPDVRVDPSDPYQVARFYESRFREDARKLGLKLAIEAEKDPTLMPRATENIAGMQAVIARLISRGHAYVTGEVGSRVVYFDVKSFAPYGNLSGNTLDNLKEGEGGRINAGNQATKRHPADFLLWKEDASHVMKWDSPWGKGYPGWHIECTAMSVSRLLAVGGSGAGPGVGATIQDLASLNDIANGNPLIDLHSGGEDNIFPHHECEIAQSCCAFNVDPGKGSFAKMWFHPRFLLVEGTKMSKSKGNFFTARDLFAKGIEPAALRLELIKTHYRSNADFTLSSLRSSQAHVGRWQSIAKQLVIAAKQPWPLRWRNVRETADVLRDFANAMHRDLNVAAAVSAIHHLLRSAGGAAAALDACYVQLGFQPPNSEAESRVEEITAALESVNLNKPVAPGDALSMFERGVREGTMEELLGALYLIDSVLGVIFVAPSGPSARATVSDIGLFAPGITPDPSVEALLRQRRDARAAKDFKASDAIRDQLAAMGFAIKDAKDGKVEVSRK